MPRGIGITTRPSGVKVARRIAAGPPIAAKAPPFGRGGPPAPPMPTGPTGAPPQGYRKGGKVKRKK